MSELPKGKPGQSLMLIYDVGLCVGDPASRGGNRLVQHRSGQLTPIATVAPLPLLVPLKRTRIVEVPRFRSAALDCNHEWYSGFKRSRRLITHES